MKAKILLCIFIAFLSSCKKEEREISINLEWTLRPIRIEKYYVFEAGEDGYQYVYVSVTTVENNILFFSAVRYPKTLSDFREKAEIISMSSKNSGETWGNTNIVQKNIATKNTTSPSVVVIGGS